MNNQIRTEANGNTNSNISIKNYIIDKRGIYYTLFIIVVLIGIVVYLYQKQENTKFYIKLNKVYSKDVIKNATFYRDENCTNKVIVNYISHTNRYLLSINIEKNKDFKKLYMKHNEYSCTELNIKVDNTSPSFMCTVDCGLSKNKKKYPYCLNKKDKSSCEREQ